MQIMMGNMSRNLSFFMYLSHQSCILYLTPPLSFSSPSFFSLSFLPFLSFPPFFLSFPSPTFFLSFPPSPLSFKSYSFSLSLISYRKESNVFCIAISFCCVFHMLFLYYLHNCIYLFTSSPFLFSLTFFPSLGRPLTIRHQLGLTGGPVQAYLIVSDRP
jgi:hypothetical protein